MTPNGDPEIGDVYDWSDSCRVEKLLKGDRGGNYYIDRYGTGPFLVVDIRNSNVKVVNLATGESGGSYWAHPCSWGKLNVFLTAAKKAIEKQDDALKRTP